MWPSFLAAAIILAVAGGLIAWHLRVRRGWLAADFAEREREFARIQFRRRMQTSVMLAVVGLTIFAEPWIAPPWFPPLAVLGYWAAVVGVVFWIVLLAVADMLATRVHYARTETIENLKQVQLRAQLADAQRRTTDERQRPPRRRGQI